MRLGLISRRSQRHWWWAFALLSDDDGTVARSTRLRILGQRRDPLYYLL